MKIIRDKMIIDRLSYSSTGVIPESIRRRDKTLLKIKKCLQKDERYRAKAGVKRSIAILYSENSFVYADYCEEEKENGYYKLHKIGLDFIN
jgi:hypothetical protein